MILRQLHKRAEMVPEQVAIQSETMLEQEEEPESDNSRAAIAVRGGAEKKM